MMEIHLRQAQKLESHRPTRRRHCARNQHADAVHRRQHPFPEGRLRRTEPGRRRTPHHRRPVLRPAGSAAGGFRYRGSRSGPRTSTTCWRKCRGRLARVSTRCRARVTKIVARHEGVLASGRGSEDRGRPEPRDREHGDRRARNEWKYVADLVTDLDTALPPVPCLPGDFNQVLLNLIINARARDRGCRQGTARAEKGRHHRQHEAGRETGPRFACRTPGTGIPESIRGADLRPVLHYQVGRQGQRSRTSHRPIGRGGQARRHTDVRHVDRPRHNILSSVCRWQPRRSRRSQVNRRRVQLAPPGVGEFGRVPAGLADHGRRVTMTEEIPVRIVGEGPSPPVDGRHCRVAEGGRRARSTSNNSGSWTATGQS